MSSATKIYTEKLNLNNQLFLRTMVESHNNGDLGYNGFPVSLNYFTALPDPSVVPYANLAVIFKSLLKRDSITKEKSLADLVKLFEDDEFSSALQDDLTVLSWVQIYPKLAVDNSRSVRIYSHQIQGRFVQLGGKSFAKYLKSSIPIWLLGSFDNDRIVANSVTKTLLQSFQQDNEKIAKIWQIFHEQIVNFITTAIVFENNESLSDKRYTKESDLVIKYERVLNGALLMLNKLIELINCEVLPFDENLEFLLNDERIWDYLGSSIDAATLNLALFKSYLIVIKSMFNSKSTTFIAGFKDINSQYKLVSKIFIKNVKLKSSSNNIIYSNIILQFWDTLISLTEFSYGPLKVKKNFWEFGGSKSFSRLIDYLKLGPCNLNPIYYSVVLHFFRVLNQGSFLDFEDVTIAETIVIKVFCKQIKKLNGFDYLDKAIECLFEIFKMFDLKISSQISHFLPIMLFTVMDAISRKPLDRHRPDVIAKLRKLFSGINTESCKDEFESQIREVASKEGLTESLDSLVIDGVKFESSKTAVIDTYFEIFNEPVERLQDFVGSIIDVLNENSELTSPKLAFYIISSFLKSNPGAGNSELFEFVDTVGSFIDTDFLVEPIQLLLSVFESGHASEVDVNEIINDCYLKLSLTAPGEIVSLLLELLNYVDFKKEKGAYSDIYNYVLELSGKEDLNGDESKLIYKFIGDLQIMDNLLKTAQINDTKSLQFVQNASTEIDVSSFIEKDFSKMMNVAWKNCLDKQVTNFLQRIRQENNTYFDDSLLGFITTESDISTDFSDIIKLLNGNYPIQKVRDLIQNAIAQVSTVDLSIANPIEENIALVNQVVKTKIDSSLILVGKFLVSALNLNVQGELLLATSLIGEYIDDILFVLPTKQIQSVADVHLLRDQINSLLLNFLKDADTNILLKVFSENGKDSSEAGIFVSKLVEGIANTDNFAFYCARISLFVFNHLFEGVDLKTFESFEINFNKLISTPLKFAVVAKSTSKFMPISSKFERIRNYIFAEILGVRSEEQILTKGLLWVTLGINFLSADEPYEVVNSHRLLMVLKQIEQWLDSSNAYDEEFIPIRVQLARFLNGLLVSQLNPPDSIFDLASRLIEDNLSQAQLVPEYSNLRYFTLKLIMSLKKKQPVEVTEDLMDLLLSKSIQAHDSLVQNQVIDLIHQVSERAYFSIALPRKLVEENKEELYRLFSSSVFSSVQRICVSILGSIISLNQQDYVVEYQLQKTSLGSEDGQLKASLPAILLENVSQFEFHDAEASSSLSKYLWSWLMIFMHFEDITFSMRSDYITQLKEIGVIEKLLDFIFDYVHVADSKLLKNSSYTLENIQDYDLRAGVQGESLESEIQFLLLHLYYLSTKYYGSTVQFWFKGIRDRQLKQQIEKFTTSFVSPLLVTKILNDVMKSKSDLEKRYENMTIKVNNVTSEIRSVYLIDDQTMEMVIKLPKEFPLENVSVEGPLRLGVKEKQWKAWLMAAQSVISLTNGTILDAIEVFNRNVNLHFSGFEDCAICYSILHQDLSLPSKSCPTCVNKFHAACLYKWFKSSGSSTCPLCRSSFNFKVNRS